MHIDLVSVSLKYELVISSECLLSTFYEQFLARHFASIWMLTPQPALLPLTTPTQQLLELPFVGHLLHASRRLSKLFIYALS